LPGSASFEPANNQESYEQGFVPAGELLLRPPRLTEAKLINNDDDLLNAQEYSFRWSHFRVELKS
jgi:hypothetical protein